MPDRELPARPNLEQYRNQAKDLAKDCELCIPDALTRIRRHHPRFHKLPESEMRNAQVALTDAQLVIAREHGFESWPRFAHHVETLNLIRSVASLTDPAAAFIEVACVPRHSGHRSGTIEHAEMILSRYPHVATSSIYTAAIRADEKVYAHFFHAIRKAAQQKAARTIGMLSPTCASRGISASIGLAPKPLYAPLGLFSMPEPARIQAGLRRSIIRILGPSGKACSTARRLSRNIPS